HPVLGDMRVHVAASHEDGRAIELARVVAWRTVRPDQPAAEANHSTVAPRVASSEFKRKARALREAKQHYAFGWEPCFSHVGKRTLQHLQGRGQPRLIALYWCHEWIRIPGIVRSLRGYVRKA